MTFRTTLVVCLVAVLGSRPAIAQQTSSPVNPTPEELRGADATQTASLDRIRRALAAPPSPFSVRTDKPLFRVEIVGKKPPFITSITPDYFVSDVTTPTGSAWHREFLNMVSPKDYSSSEISGAIDQLMAAAQTAAAFWLAKSIFRKVSAVRNSRERAAILAQIERELREIEERRKKAEDEEKKKKPQ